MKRKMVLDPQSNEKLSKNSAIKIHETSDRGEESLQIRGLTLKREV